MGRLRSALHHARTGDAPEHASDRGSASVLVIGLVVVLLVVAGLVVDGGRAVNARAQIMDDAEQAARVAANQIDIGQLRATGTGAVDPGAARAAATSFLAGQGYAASRVTVSADTDRVTVQVQDDVPTALLSLILIRSFPVEGRATARAAVGIVGELGAP